MPTRERTGISLKAAAFDRARHVCAFFNSAAEQYEVLTPFVREGLQAGEKAFYIVNPLLKSEHRARLAVFGICGRGREARPAGDSRLGGRVPAR